MFASDKKIIKLSLKRPLSPDERVLPGQQVGAGQGGGGERNRVNFFQSCSRLLLFCSQYFPLFEILSCLENKIIFKDINHSFKKAKRTKINVILILTASNIREAY